MSAIQSPLLLEGNALLRNLSSANKAYMARFPGDCPNRQPIHSVYGGAQLFKATTASKLGELALGSLEQYAPDAFTLATILNLSGSQSLMGLSETEKKTLRTRFEQDPNDLRSNQFGAWLAQIVYERVVAKLRNEPVEDIRIDFEDGYGNRSDHEEDAEALRSAKEVAKAMAHDALPPFVGIRIKQLNEEHKNRAVRTLDLFLSTLVKETGGAIPSTFLITLPKVTIPEQVSCLVGLLDILETRLNLAPKTLKVELMIEVTQTIFDSQGRSNIPLLIEQCDGRCFSAHFGTYDYTASCAVTAAYQTMDHSACDFAKHMMLNTLSGTGVFVSDGATNIMPVGPHRLPNAGELNEALQNENRQAIHHAWKTSYDHIRHSLQGGFYQGWDLHPAQLPIRYAACYAFFLEGFDAAAQRLRNFIEKAAQATLVGDVFDDAATGQGLLNYFLRALNCGAISIEEMKAIGLTKEEIQIRSFGKILDARRTRLNS